jgi:hypothetical protein
VRLNGRAHARTHGAVRQLSTIAALADRATVTVREKYGRSGGGGGGGGAASPLAAAVVDDGRF